MKNTYYLKSDIIPEPLVNQWYAHPFLISPATSTMLTTYSHLPIMQSYVDNPKSHEQMLKYTEMVGGPFVALESYYQEWVKELLKFTQTQCSQHIAFAQGIKQLMIDLKKEALGKSLDSFYLRLPTQLKGYLELYYDLMDQPGFRLLEKLLYHSPYYRSDFQSICLSVCKEDFRPFSLSTPRPLKEASILVQLPFQDLFYDELFKLRFKSVTQSKIAALYDQIPYHSNNSFEKFFEFFTENIPQSNLPKNQTAIKLNPGIKIQYIGHACLLMQTDQVNIITDPVIGYPFENCSPRFTYADLPERIDYLLITHNHQDHVLIEHLLQLRGRVDTVIVPRCGSGSLQDPSLKLLFNHLGFTKIIEVDDLDTIAIPNGQITAVPFLGEHGDFNIRTKTTYAIHLNGQKILCIADSVALDETLYHHVHQCIGDVDALFLSMECDGAAPTWLYGAFLPEPLPRSMALSRKLNASDCDAALRMVSIFNCKKIYLYAMGQESWLNYIMNVQYADDSIPMIEVNRLKQICQQKKISFKTLKNYEELIL